MLPAPAHTIHQHTHAHTYTQLSQDEPVGEEEDDNHEFLDKLLTDDEHHFLSDDEEIRLDEECNSDYEGGFSDDDAMFSGSDGDDEEPREFDLDDWYVFLLPYSSMQPN